MIKRFPVAAFLSSMMFSGLALGSVHITFKGTAGSIDEQEYYTANKKIAALLELGAVRKYVVSSIDVEGSAQICVEFIGCTSQDEHYLNLLTKELGESPSMTAGVSKTVCP